MVDRSLAEPSAAQVFLAYGTQLVLDDVPYNESVHYG